MAVKPYLSKGNHNTVLDCNVQYSRVVGVWCGYCCLRDHLNHHGAGQHVLRGRNGCGNWKWFQVKNVTSQRRFVLGIELHPKPDIFKSLTLTLILASSTPLSVPLRETWLLFSLHEVLLLSGKWMWHPVSFITRGRGYYSQQIGIMAVKSKAFEYFAPF